MPSSPQTANKRIVSVNPSFSRLTGYDLTDVVGQNPTLLGSGNARCQQLSDHVGCAWINPAAGLVNCRVQYKNGTTVFEWLTVNAVKGADGVVTGYHFIFSDVSERQLNEEKLRRLMSLDSLTQLPNRAMFADGSMRCWRTHEKRAAAWRWSIST